MNKHFLPADNSRVSFFCRMMEKALTRNDPGRYEIVHVVGQLKPIDSPASLSVPASPASSVVSLSPGVISSSDTEETYESDGESDTQSQKASVNRIGTHMLVGFVRVVKDRPITELSLVESTLDEYITRHGLKGNILYTDHRCGQEGCKHL
ncbi:hypothetical protein GWK47_009899 [Chionoecetes opilio]|uniref:Uncharacterized protein n=1 Tax=Chionoecetes opilio TaxID=41210 RepID=A0A8J5CPE8_CHIOP|nr:hypothetical protein GWK47_009899 [Chionoecetes opilio]